MSLAPSKATSAATEPLRAPCEAPLPSSVKGLMGLGGGAFDDLVVAPLDKRLEDLTEIGKGLRTAFWVMAGAVAVHGLISLFTSHRGKE